MQCNDVLPQLNALADGELNAGESQSLQQHLDECANCAQTMLQIHEIGALAREWRAVSAPASLQSRIVEALAKSPANAMERSTATSSATIAQPAADPFRPVRTPLQPGAARPSTASLFSHSPLGNRAGRSWRPGALLLGIGVAAGLLALLMMPTRKTVAFAAVLQAMQQVKTIHWVLRENGVKAPQFGLNDASVTVHLETWARLDKPAYALLLTPDGFSRTVLTPEKMSMIVNNRRTKEVRISNPKKIDREQALRTFILVQVISPGKDASANAPGALDAARLPDKNQYGFKSEQTELDGRSVVRFYQERKSRTGSLTLSLWVDPDTQLVVRSEAVVTNPTMKEPTMHVVCDQFRYNDPPPAGIFDTPKR